MENIQKAKNIIWKRDTKAQLSAERYEGYIGRKCIGTIVLTPMYECAGQVYRAFLCVDEHDTSCVEHKTLPGVKKLVDRKVAKICQDKIKHYSNFIE